MITISADTHEASQEEAEAYVRSMTRLFLLYATPIDLAGHHLTIGGKNGTHFLQRYTNEEWRKVTADGKQPPLICPTPERSREHALSLLKSWINSLS